MFYCPLTHSVEKRDKRRTYYFSDSISLGWLKSDTVVVYWPEINLIHTSKRCWIQWTKRTIFQVRLYHVWRVLYTYFYYRYCLILLEWKSFSYHFYRHCIDSIVYGYWVTDYLHFLIKSHFLYYLLLENGSQ